ncbi:U7 snRNA-associated Sm-like protein LSm10, partial [Tetrabaena socialis]
MHGAAPKRKRLTPKPRHPPREETTLVCLIKSLVDSKVVVELRNDILLRGRLDDVDDFLNMSLSNVTFQTVEGHKATYQSMYLKGRNLRFVHLPKTLDPAAAVDSYRRKVVASKLAALQERARALGEGKREGKGQDADMGMEQLHQNWSGPRFTIRKLPAGCNRGPFMTSSVLALAMSSTFL